MVESEWPELAGKQLRYGDHTWELTGVVDVIDRGETLEVEATRVDSVKGERADLRFSIEDGLGSLNPGSLEEHFDALVREDDRHYLVVKRADRRYRYELRNYSPR